MPTISETLVAAALATPNLDEAADALGRAVEGAYGATGASRGVKDFLNGTWLGHPLHPVVTDIPVGAWTVALVLDALGERRAAKIAVGIGLLGAVGAAVSGLTDWIDTYGKPRRLGVVHAAVNGSKIELSSSKASVACGSATAELTASGVAVTGTMIKLNS